VRATGFGSRVRQPVAREGLHSTAAPSIAAVGKQREDRPRTTQLGAVVGTLRHGPFCR
jgi:hypothetical protein